MWQKGVDGLGGNQRVKTPEVYMRPKRKCSRKEEVRKLGGWKVGRWVSQSKVLDGLERATVERKNDCSSEVHRSWVPSGENE